MDTFNISRGMGIFFPENGTNQHFTGPRSLILPSRASLAKQKPSDGLLAILSNFLLTVGKLGILSIKCSGKTVQIKYQHLRITLEFVFYNPKNSNIDCLCSDVLFGMWNITSL